jgi:hypothetical protein
MQSTLTSPPPTLIGRLAGLWAVIGVTLFLLRPIAMLTPIAWAAVHMPLHLFQWVLTLVWIAFMAFSEGYKGFQKKFAPRFAARLNWLIHNPGFIEVLLAPFFCMGYFKATRKRMITTWSITTAIALLVVGVKQLPDPWRGLLDTGVIVGLGWGLACVIYESLRVLGGAPPKTDPEMPEHI